MNRIILAVFDTEDQAAKGLNSMAALDNDGQITVYASAVFTKREDGKIDVKQAGDQGPVGTTVGMLLGGLIGALAGPAGLVAGAAIGTLGGSISDLYKAGVDTRFADDVASVLTPGKFALVADIDEEWTGPVDAALGADGGTVFRRNRVDIEDAQWEQDVAADQAELDALQAELKEASAERKADIQKRIDEVKAHMADTRAKWSNKVESLKAEAEAKVKKLEAQHQAASAERKAKIDARRASLKANLENRAGKLKAAFENLKDAVKL